MTSATARIKICGFRRLEDVELAVALGVDMLGFNCWAGSPRHVPIDELRPLVRAVPQRTEVVLVFVRAETDEVARTLAAIDARSQQLWIQLHGDEDPTRYAHLGVPAIQVLRVGGAEPSKVRASRVLVDVRAPTFGGTGLRVDPGELARLLPALPLGWILAGGLDVENVRDAIRRYSPGAVDVASGVEVSPGVKDHAKMTAFVAAVREASQAIEASVTREESEENHVDC